MKTLPIYILLFIVLISCNRDNSINENIPENSRLEFGGDFSIMKKMEDLGGLYKLDSVVKEGFEIFKENGYTWARLRILHSPDLVGPNCNDLAYTIKSAQKAKQFGFKILVNFHYSDSWADPGHQSIPQAWDNLSFSVVQDSMYSYTKHVLTAMDNAGVLPDMVQIGNEINNGFIWPHGKLWTEPGVANWDNLTKLLNTGIQAVRDLPNGSEIKIMVHAGTGGDVNSAYRFYKNILEFDVEFDVIGLSYYPWWHGTFIDLESTILYLSNQFPHEFSIVETAYYSNNWYPLPDNWTLNEQPYPSSEQGQYDFLFELAEVMKKQPRVKTIFYWRPDELEIPKSKINYLGRSLFDNDGDALMAISAWKDVPQ